MRLLIFGATGEIGSAVVEAALEAGHVVTTFVRSPERLRPPSDRVRVVQGDLNDPGAVARAIRGQEAVVSAIGSSPDRSQLDVPATAMRHIVMGMQQSGVRRLIGLAGGAVRVPGERKPLSGRVASAFVRLMARYVVEAKQREFEVVVGTDLDWTMVRPPRVVDGGPTGRVEIGEQLHGFRITRGDLASAMVALAAEPAWLRQAPYVSERLG